MKRQEPNQFLNRFIELLRLLLCTILVLILNVSCSSEEENPCKIPTEAAIGTIDENFAFLFWAQASDAVTRIDVGPAGYNPPENFQSIIFGNFIVLGPLRPSSSYDAYLRSNCGLGEKSETIGPISFTTLDFGQGCTQPNTIVVDIISETTVEISWKGLDETLWEIAIGEHGFLAGEDNWKESTELSYLFDEVVPDLSYDVYVRAKCGTFSFSSSATLINQVLIPE